MIVRPVRHLYLGGYVKHWYLRLAVATLGAWTSSSSPSQHRLPLGRLLLEVELELRGLATGVELELLGAALVVVVELALRASKALLPYT